MPGTGCWLGGRWLLHLLCALTFASASGCGNFIEEPSAPLFRVPLSIEGQSVGSAIIDTGGGYEVLLRDDFGLGVIGRMDVLAFGGFESVEVTRGFHYQAGGVEAIAESAIVGLSACDCNGLGVDFLRKAGIAFAVDFQEGVAAFLPDRPNAGITLDFLEPPDYLAGFDSAFVEVTISSGTRSRRVLGLLDTGATETVMRRGLLGGAPLLSPNLMNVRVRHDQLGSVAVNVRLFDTNGLPAIILGTDIMRAWADRWYFSYAPEGGTVVVIPRDDDEVLRELGQLAAKSR